MRLILADHGGGISRQRGQPDHRLIGRKRDAARGGQADPQAGEAARAGGHRDTVQRGERQAGLLHHAGKQRHQGFGVPALHGLGRLCDQPARAGVENRGCAGIERGIDGEDQHVPLLTCLGTEQVKGRPPI